MKLKAILKGNRLYFNQGIVFKKPEMDVEIEVPDEAIESVDSGKSFSEELRSLFKQFPDSELDWGKEWHKHLEGKYNA